MSNLRAVLCEHGVPMESCQADLGPSGADGSVEGIRNLRKGLEQPWPPPTPRRRPCCRIGEMKLAPCTVKAALRKVKEWHRRLPDLQGGLFAVQCVDADGQCLGVGVAGNPCMEWQNTGRLVISRVATPGAENACSMLYGALCRSAKALGYREAWTYTMPGEPGTSLRAAGFMDMGLTDGGEHSRQSRPRKPAVCSDPKRRWLRRLCA